MKAHIMRFLVAIIYIQVQAIMIILMVITTIIITADIMMLNRTHVTAMSTLETIMIIIITKILIQKMKLSMILIVKAINNVPISMFIYYVPKHILNLWINHILILIPLLMNLFKANFLIPFAWKITIVSKLSCLFNKMQAHIHIIYFVVILYMTFCLKNVTPQVFVAP